MRLERVDPSDELAYRRWFSVVDEVASELWPGSPGWQAPELRALLRGTSAATSAVGIRATNKDGAPLGAVMVSLTRRDNLHMAEVDHLSVLSRMRRRGVGTSLLAAAEQIARDDGRALVSAMHEKPPWLAGRSPGRAFALANRYASVQCEVRRDLVLPVDADLLDALKGSARQFASGYRVLTWLGWYTRRAIASSASATSRSRTDVPSAAPSKTP